METIAKNIGDYYDQRKPTALNHHAQHMEDINRVKQALGMLNSFFSEFALCL